MKNTPENRVKQEIKDYLDITGWFHFPLTQGLGSHPGLPDRIAIKNGIVLFIEIKASGNPLTEKQKDFCRQVRERGGRYMKVTGYEDIKVYLTEVE